MPALSCHVHDFSRSRTFARSKYCSHRIKCKSVWQKKIEEFRNSIEFRDNDVDLLWYEDKINFVPSNYKGTLAVSHRTMQSLEWKNLLKKYNEILSQQHNDIIERIHVSLELYEKFIWIPHRLVFKTESQATTKIKPVFNCLLKTASSFLQSCLQRSKSDQ